MPIGYIIAIIIAVVALVALVVGGVMVFKTISSTMDNVGEVQSTVQGQIDHFTHEADAIKNRVNTINERVTAITEMAKDKQATFTTFADDASEFGNSITYLKDQSGDISKNLMKNTTDRVKEEGPSKAKMVKEVAKRTFEKQKRRYS